MYFLHPNKELAEAFKNKPYQGALPESARYLFIGLDANYAQDIELNEVFPQVIEYLQDGVSFWEHYGVHHPFLLPAYHGDGQFYHKSFSRIGLGKGHAKEICFIELFDKPTYGKSDLAVNDLNIDHLLKIKGIIESGSLRYVFLPTSVGKLMRQTDIFPWLPPKPRDIDSSLKHWCCVGTTQIFWHYHFSVYGKFESSKSKQLKELGRLLKK